MKKNAISVGKNTIYATTVPVNTLLDHVYNAPSFPTDLEGDRFQLLEIDDYYLVIHEMLYLEAKPAKQEFKCFTDLDDAKEYLRMFGVKVDEDEIHEKICCCTEL
jgi:hypothetical protein